MKNLYLLRNYLSPYKWQIILNLVILIAIIILSLFIPKVIAGVIDNGLRSGYADYLARSAVVIFGIGLGIATLNLSQRYLTEWIAAHVGYDLRNVMYNRIQYLPFSYHDHTTTGQLINRCIEDVRAVQSFSGSGIIDTVHLALISTGVIYVLITTNPVLALVALLPLVPMLLMTTSFGKRITGLFYDVDNNLGDLSAHVQENVSGVQVVRAFAREPYEIKRFEIVNRRYFRSRIKILREWSKVLPTSHLLITMGTILILLVGGPMVMDGKMSIGDLVAFNAYVLMLSMPVQQLAWWVNALGESEAGAQRVIEIINRAPEIKSPENAKVLECIRGHVSFKNVSLRYQGEKVDALDDISLEVHPNQVIALIGKTGSGKSSFVNLIPRFYDVTNGTLRIDGIDVRHLDLESLRSQIGIVMQSSLLFSDTIMENIRYGRTDASMSDVIDSAKIAQAHDFITKFEGGYDTMVGERGVTLSGGQRQRIAIARALLMEPKILILDDATSSVDTQTEQELQQALRNIMKGRTTFIVAHRLATVRWADMILVMDDGKIVEKGNHQTLIGNDGLYREIYELQLNQKDRFLEDKDSDDEFFVRSRDEEVVKRLTSVDRGIG